MALYSSITSSVGVFVHLTVWNLSIVKNIYLDTHHELHLEVALDNVVGIVAVHLRVLKAVQINSAWSKKNISIPRSTFYNARELSYTIQWPWTLLLAWVYI